MVRRPLLTKIRFFWHVSKSQLIMLSSLSKRLPQVLQTRLHFLIAVLQGLLRKWVAHAELLNLTECKNWLQALPSQEILQNKSLQRLQEVLDLLQRPSSREQRQKIQKLLCSWEVLRQTQGRKRKYDETKADLVAKIVEETHRLRRMRHEFEEPIPDGSDRDTSARFSAIQASLQHRGRARLLSIICAVLV